ncbi:MAG: hypothetical protein RMK29_11260 [Myxococcales bacterium]|nr:hypothetical protein [Myxococcota bacterium]MDW8282285.1 hypothetical protein [Myxococcales bacterium]
MHGTNRPGRLPLLAALLWACGDASLQDVEQRLVGSYASRSTVATLQEVPLVGKIPSTVTILGLADVLRGEGGLRMQARGCRVVIQGAPGITTTVADAVPQSAAPQDTPLLLSREGEVVRWSRPEAVTLLGVRLTDPEREPLPTTDNDPRVVDQEGDGKPGVTIRVMSALASGEIYVVQRQRNAMAGTVQGDALIGLISDRSEQSVIGASHPLLKQNLMTEPDPDVNKSQVRLVRLAGRYDCTRVIAEEGTLFR